MRHWLRSVVMVPLFCTRIMGLVFLGAVPGAAEPGTENKMGAAAAGGHLHENPKFRALL